MQAKAFASCNKTAEVVVKIVAQSGVTLATGGSVAVIVIIVDTSHPQIATLQDQMACQWKHVGKCTRIMQQITRRTKKWWRWCWVIIANIIILTNNAILELLH